MSAIRPFYHLLPLHLYYRYFCSKSVYACMHVCVCVCVTALRKDPGTLLDSESFQLFFANVLNNGILMEREQTKKRKRRKRERGKKKKRNSKKEQREEVELKKTERNLCIHLSLHPDLHQQQAYHYSLSLPFYCHYSLFVSFFNIIMICRDFTCSCKKDKLFMCPSTCMSLCDMQSS